MTIQTTTDQAECIMALRLAGIMDRVKPIPPRRSCVALYPLDETCWLACENDNGVYTLHMLTDTTKAEAFGFLDSKLKGRKPSALRLSFAENFNTQCN